MQVITPPPERTLGLQQSEGSYYFSGAIDVVLRKHGARLKSGALPAIVARESEWDGPIESLLFEGCLSDTSAKCLGVAVRRHRAQRLPLFDAYGEPMCTLRYGRAAVRWIPSRSDDPSEPYEFVSHDPLWNGGGFDFQTFDETVGAPCLLALVDGDKRIVGMRKGSAVVLGIPLLDLIVQHHASPPYDAGYFEMLELTDGLGELERWLLARLKELGNIQLDDLWPQGYSSALTVRHDYDRPIEDQVVEKLLACYAERRIKSTWFWRLGLANRGQSDRVIGAGHEVGLHTEAADERAFLREVEDFEAAFGVRPAGYSAHGGIPAPGNLGLRQFEWAIGAGMRYGEMLGGARALPHEAVVIRDGIPVVSGLVIPAPHKGLDISTDPDGHALDTLLPEASVDIASGAHCVPMNHPDIHIDELIRLLDGLDLSGVWPATLEQVAGWFATSRAQGR